MIYEVNNMKKPKYSIIIATRNEFESIANVLDAIPKSVKNKSEVIVVDSSIDETPEIARRHGARVITEKRKGKGRAMKTGAEKSRGKILIFLDGDGTDPPQYIPKLVEKLKHADIALAYRSFKNFEEDDLNMKLIFRLYAPPVLILFRIVGFKIWGDPLAGFRAIRKKDWKKLSIKSNDFLIETEINLKAIEMGLRMDGTPIPNLKRGGGLGRSKFLSSPRMWIKMVAAVLGYAINGRISGM